jgi:ankyrin repeat protein
MAGFIPEAAAAPYSPDGNGTTAMHVAAAQGHSDTLAAFIHVSPAGCNVKDALGFTALDAALNHGQFHLPPMLIAAGCTMRLPDSSGSGSGDVPSKVGTRAMKADDHDGRRHAEPSDENVTESLPLGVPSAEVTRCLEILAASDPIKDARFASIPPDLPVFRDILGNDVSFFSCCAAAGHLSALNALRRQQGDDCMAHELPNAMLLAVRAGHAEVVRWLAADPRCSPEACKEHALLHQAAALGCNETLKALLEGGWDPSEVHGGTTPLQEAVRYGNLCSTETLLQATRELQNSKQILNHMDVRGWTAVHAAAASGDVKMLRALLDAGASPSVSLATVANSSQRERGKLGGVMAIHLAAKEGRLAAMHQLLEAGCDPTLADARGWTTLHYVAQRGDFASFALLNGNGASAGLLSSASPQSAASLLTASVLGGSEEIVKAVLSAGMAAPEACVAAGETPVHAAACEGFVRALIYLRDAGFDLCSKDTEGRSPLHQVPTGYGHAARAGLRHNDFIAAAELLLDAGCEVNAADSHGCTPLHIAAGCGSSEMLDRFLKLASSQETKARCNVPDEIGWTPLFWAASEGHEFSVALLLAAGADPCATDCNHRIPLHFAAEGGHLPCVRALLSDMQQRTKATAADLHVPDQNGQTPLMLAAEAGHVDVVAALLDAAPTNDAPAGEAESKRRNALHLLAQQGQEDILQHVLEARRLHPSAKDADGWAPLHHAAVAGHVVVTALLLAAGAEVDDSASDGDVPLHKAALGGHLDVVDALLQARATVDARNASGSTPLYNAASQGHCDVVACLLEAGAAPDATTSNGCSPLYIAANNGWQEAVALLLSYDADPNLQATGGCGPLHAAAMNGHAGVVESLLEHHACDADLQSSNGSTPLHNAAASGHVAAVNALLAGNADTDVENTAGNTPLHMAAGKGWVDVVDRLVEAGADLAVKNQKNLTPVQSAASSGYFEAVLKLVQQGSPWKQKGDGDVVRLLSRKTTLKLSYIEGRLRLAEKERQRRLAKAGNGGRTPHGGAGLGGEIAGHTERSEEDLKAAQAQADAAMAALLQEEQAEKVGYRCFVPHCCSLT